MLKIGKLAWSHKGMRPGLYYILKENGTWTVQSTMQPVTINDYAKYPELKEEMMTFPNSKQKIW